MQKKVIYITIMLFSYVSFGQIIKGSLKNSNGETISFATILLKENNSPSTIIEFTTARNGIFNLSLKKKYQTLLVEVTTQEYYNETFIIESPKIDQIYVLDFILQKQDVTELKEVVVVSEKKAFSIKEDTVTYNLEKYKDVGDRKVQDVLKRLPGIEVNEKSGEIKYKGKSIETVTLDGDNLFGYNYSLGTKNINVDMVEQVQAIDNYSENPLLKGIEGGEKVSLNLKLKKGKTDYSGNIDFGLGVNNDIDLLNNTNANLLGVAKKYKSFGTLNFNNIGINHSPFDYFSSNRNIEQQKERDFTTHKIIPEALFNNGINDDRANINNMFFGNYNSIFKINKRLSLRTNLYIINDRINLNQINTSEIKIENETFTTIDDFNTIKKPQLYRGDIELKHNTSKNSLLEYRTKFSYEEIVSNSLIQENKLNSFSSDLKSQNNFFNQKLIYTSKINDNQAIQIQLNHAFNDAPQILFLNNQSASIIEKQSSNFTKNFSDAIITVLGNESKCKYSFSLGGASESTLYNSLNALSQVIGNNSSGYLKKSLYLLGSTNYVENNWTLIPSISLKYLAQDLNEFQRGFNESNSNFLFEPSLNIRYKINSTSFISSTVSQSKTPFSEEYIFINPITTSNRIKITNTPTLEIQKTETYSFNYYSNNLYKQFILSIGMTYQQNNGNYFSSFIINENETMLNNFYLKERNDNFNFSLSTEKFVSKLSSTFKFSSTISKSKYKNILNTADLRNNISSNLINELDIKTAFNGKINFENIVNYNYSSNENENSGTFNNKMFTNSFKFKYKHSPSIFSVISGDYFVPNSNNLNNNYIFIDFSIIFKPKNRKYELNVVGKNLLDNTVFTQIQTSDFSRNTLQNNLVSRYIYINFTYNL